MTFHNTPCLLVAAACTPHLALLYVQFLAAIAATVIEEFIIVVPSSRTLGFNMQNVAVIAASSFLTPPQLDLINSTRACNIADMPDAPLHVIGFKLNKQP
ncbi:hypothetical protein C8R43DRAFT_1140830 [Mycena crocata]|nr:hypothetical protein C8R43DRAFT_1140830 [Mycena crocata]